MNRTGTIAVALVLSIGLCTPAAEIPAPKLSLIRQAMAAINLDARVRALVAARVEARLQAIRAANPGLSDSLATVARAAVASAYEDGLDGPDGLFPRVYGVLDRRLGDEDLRFVLDFHGSDQGRRYKEMVPRIVAECVEAGRQWAEGREVEVRARLDIALRGTDVKF